MTNINWRRILVCKRTKNDKDKDYWLEHEYDSHPGNAYELI